MAEHREDRTVGRAVSGGDETGIAAAVTSATAGTARARGAEKAAGATGSGARQRRRAGARALAGTVGLRRAVDRLDNITRVLGSDAQLAEVLGVSRSQPGRWREGQEPDPENRDRIIGLDAVIALLSGYLAESSIPKWLNGVNAHLDNRRPINVLREGRVSDVIAAIEAQKSGAFA